MNYPTQVEGVGLKDGKFVNENPATGQQGSLIPAEWGNNVTDELLNIVQEAGLTPDETKSDQVKTAFLKMTVRADKPETKDTVKQRQTLDNLGFTQLIKDLITDNGSTPPTES